MVKIKVRVIGETSNRSSKLGLKELIYSIEDCIGLIGRKKPERGVKDGKDRSRVS